MMKEPKVKFHGKGWKFRPRSARRSTGSRWKWTTPSTCIEAVDEYTVVFRLKRVEAPFLANMGMDFADIISPAAFLKNPKEFLRNPVGTGPFKFVSGSRTTASFSRKTPRTTGTKPAAPISTGWCSAPSRRTRCAFSNSRPATSTSASSPIRRHPAGQEGPQLKLVDPSRA
jgi:ABC-type transport system substrate-binding protein